MEKEGETWKWGDGTDATDSPWRDAGKPDGCCGSSPISCGFWYYGDTVGLDDYSCAKEIPFVCEYCGCCSEDE